MMDTSSVGILLSYWRRIRFERWDEIQKKKYKSNFFLFKTTTNGPLYKVKRRRDSTNIQTGLDDNVIVGGLSRYGWTSSTCDVDTGTL